jgi:outer membrane lipoprotein-sorting protein
MKLTSLTRRPVVAALAGALALALPAGYAALPQAAAAQATGSGQLDQVATALRGITTMRADFVQTDRSGQALSGTLTLKRPGKIRFAYDDANMLIVSNGGALTFVDYDVQQEERWPISDSPLGALLDPERDVKRYGRLMPSPDPDVVSVEVADPRKPEFGRITLIMVRDATAPGGLELASWVALDSQNRRTTVRLSNQRYGVSVADSEFRHRSPRRTTRRPR